MGDMTAHFSRREFRCPDCGYDAINTSLVQRLEQARQLFGKPMVVTSGARCKKHNAAVGGLPDSAHLKGLAADILCRSSETRYQLLMAFLTVAFPRLEIAPEHIHVDIDQSKPQDVCVLTPT
jgi:zinc D-Ala-D-Ala carboxypeptidase